MDGYRVPAGRHRVEETIKGSLFIATAGRVSSPDEARTFVELMKKEFRGATHNCHAFVSGPPGGGATGMGDDGEPRGTAGPPMHQVLIHGEVGEIAVVVTRYSSGIKLGTGGLVRAYSGLVKHCLESLPTLFHATAEPIWLEVGYPHLKTVKHELEVSGGELLHEDFSGVVRLSIRLPRGSRDAFLARVACLAAVVDA